MALIAGKIGAAAHHYIEIHDPSIRLAQSRFDAITQRWDIRASAQDATAFAEGIRKEAGELRPTAVIFSAGFPCRELSRVNRGRRGLRAGETARFEEAKVLYKALIEIQTTTDPDLMAVWECVQSVTIDAATAITRELRELDERIGVTGIDATGTPCCRRLRLWWTSFHVAKIEY